MTTVRVHLAGALDVLTAPEQLKRAQYDYLLISSDLLSQFKTRAVMCAAAVDTMSRRGLPGRPWWMRALRAVAALALLLRRVQRA